MTHLFHVCCSVLPAHSLTLSRWVPPKSIHFAFHSLAVGVDKTAAVGSID